jgi:hypothetical protein
MRTKIILLIVLFSAVFTQPMPGSGIHDYLPTLNREQLERWALAAEYHHNLSYGEMTIGGLHDYIGSLTNADLMKYITNKTKEHPELNDITFFRRLLKKLNYEGDNSSAKFEGLEAVVPKLNRQDLERFALSLEHYHRKVNNITLFGGLHDYIYNVTSTFLQEYINLEIKEHPEINNRNFFDSVFTPEVRNLGGIHDVLFRLNRTDLERWSLRAEDYHNQINNLTMIRGGLEDKLMYMTNKDIINYILKEVKEHPAIDKISFFEKKMKTNVKFGGLHDIVFRLERKELEKWALIAESFHSKALGGQGIILGGLHDKLFYMSNGEIAKYILDMAKEHPELNNATFYRQNTERVENRQIGGGLHDIIPTLNRTELINWAFTLERYHKKINNSTGTMGGLHDYIRLMNDTDIATYIVAELREHPEVNNRNIFFGLLNERKNGEKRFEVKKSLKFLSVNEEKPLIGGGLHDHLRGSDRETLKKYALSIEKYEREELGMKFLGGIHDYIDTVSDNELRVFIMRKAKRYPTLNSVSMIKEISSRK